VGALSRNLADLQERQGSYLSIYDQPASALKVCSFLCCSPDDEMRVFLFPSNRFNAMLKDIF
jgi:hypothetical protein